MDAAAIEANSCTGAGCALYADAARPAVRGCAFAPLVFTGRRGGHGALVTLEREARPFSLWFEFRFARVGVEPSIDVVTC